MRKTLSRRAALRAAGAGAYAPGLAAVRATTVRSDVDSAGLTAPVTEPITSDP